MKAGIIPGLQPMMLKSDYFRIEIEVLEIMKRELDELKSD